MAFDELTGLYLNCHESVREMVKLKTGKYPEDYKKYEKERIDRFFKNIPYKGKNILEFTSIMMSELIVTHGLPNTNHRTTILFTSMILRGLKFKFPNYDTSVGKEKWIDDCNNFIKGSKEILSKRKTNKQYKDKHLEWTRKWLTDVTDHQSMSSGMMSFHLLSSLRKISSSEDIFSSVIK